MKWFKLRKPKDPSEQFIGETITAYPTAQDAWARTNGDRLKVEHIAGNLTHQTMFQVNGSHLVSMLDAYCEINGEALPNLELHQDFLATVAEHVQKDAEPKKTLSLIDRSPTHV